MILFRKDSRECIGGCEIKFDTTNAKGLKTMLRKNIIMLVSFVLLAVMLSLSVLASYGGSASASSSGASASAWSDVDADLLARARINSLIYYVNDTDEHIGTSASASVSASQLTNTYLYPPTDSYATAWVGDVEVDWDSWSAN